MMVSFVMAGSVMMLAGCGGGGGQTAGTVPIAVAPVVAPLPTTVPSPPPPPPPPPSEPPFASPTGAGTLQSATTLARIAAGDITQAINASGSSLPGVAARYGVRCYKLSYATSDGAGKPVVASGLVAVPDKPSGQESPVISYQHGTTFKDAEAPSNAIGASEAPIIMASMGYIVLAPDYVGYGASKASQHPYLLAAPTAAAVNDFITAARLWRTQNGTLGNGQLFLVGYSEGAYATVAAHRALQDSASPHMANLVAVVAGAGPYHVGVTLDAALERVRQESRVLAALISPGLLSRLGSTVRNEVRRAMLRQIVPDDADVSFQSTFLDNYLADDGDAIERMSNVHDWRPNAPLRLFHGKDDLTVPYAASTRALLAMQARGAPVLSLTDCPIKPAGHIACVPIYFSLMLAHLGTLARNL